MSTAMATPAEQRVLLTANWATYERLLAETVRSPGTRFAYDDGEIEIMVVSIGHENPASILERLVFLWGDEMRRDIQCSRSTTFKRPDLEKACEPDSSFYLRHPRSVRDKSELDLMVDPPPDLVIEVDITRSSLNRFRIFASLGIDEVWRYDGEVVTMNWREGRRYERIEESRLLPPLTAVQATSFLRAAKHQDSFTWADDVRAWVREHKR